MNDQKAEVRQMPHHKMRHHSHKRFGPIALLVALATVSLASSASATGGDANAAKAISLNENGNLHLTGKHGFTLNEQGLASGTVRGTIYVHLSIVSSNRVTAELSIYPNGGSITASGSASYRREHTRAVFSGTMSIKRGTGSYAHAGGSGLSFSGTIARANDAVTVHVAGKAFD
jgi:hypothetical protein